MSQRLLSNNTRLRHGVCAVGILLSLVFGWTAARAFFIDTIAERLDTKMAGAGEIADLLVRSLPWDPAAELSAAIYHEQVFDLTDSNKALACYTRAAELEPNN